MLDWLIIGGGPHGTHMAIRLLDGGLPLDRIAIIDPHTEPLARWTHHTGNAGMSHLRSPEVHNLDVSPYSLGNHAHSGSFLAAKREQTETESTSVPDFIPPYSRPSLQLFMHHVHSIVERTNLMRRWVSGLASAIHRVENGYRVETAAGKPIEARNVVLALGIGDQPYVPSWARQLDADVLRPRVHHIFSPKFHRTQIDGNHDVVIVGAGISAAQLALSLLAANPDRKITMVARHFLKKEDFDSDPGWLGPKLLHDFHAERNYATRRAMIQEARNKGSLATEVMHGLQSAILHEKAIQWEMGEIDRVSQAASGSRLQVHVYPFELDESQYRIEGEVAYKLGNTAQVLETDTLVLATGFDTRRPGGALVDDAIARMQLPTAEDGFPIVDHYMRWCDGLFVMGALAELEMGPASRNISGARMAAERIMESSEVDASVNPHISFHGSGVGEMAG